MSELFSSVLAKFPPPDLSQELIDLYFLHSNDLFPLLHRPTFDRQWREKLYQRDVWFAAVCMAIFAIASRWVDDPRVIKDNARTASGDHNWGLAGRSYFETAMGWSSFVRLCCEPSLSLIISAIHQARRSVFYPAPLFEIQLCIASPPHPISCPALWCSCSAGF